MFIIDLAYKVPLEKVDEYRNAHLEFLDKYFGQKIFLMSGPKVPRTGGIIIANNVSKFGIILF